jgi:hypothetical protein
MKNLPVFTLSDEVIEIGDSYSYHGLVMNYYGSFAKAKSKLIEQAGKKSENCFWLLTQDFIF